jgi:hypothetical protein
VQPAAASEDGSGEKGRRSRCAEARCKEKGGSQVDSSTDEQANAFLPQAFGASSDQLHQARQKLGDHLFAPLQEDLVGLVRLTFGLPAEGAVDALGPLFAEEEVGSDD